MTTTEFPVETEVMLPPSQLTPNPLNPRRTLPDLTGLVDSIKAMGLLQPIVVFKTIAGEYVILAGHCRAAACVQAGLDLVPVLVRPEPEAGQQIALMLTENVQRNDLTPIEEGIAFQQMKDEGWSNKDIAAEVGVAESHITKRLGLATLPAEAQAQVLLPREDRRSLRLDYAYDLSRLRDPKLVVKLAEQVAGQTEYYAKEQIKLALGDQKRTDAAIAVAEKLMREGETVVDHKQLANGTAAILPNDLYKKQVGKVHVLALDVTGHDKLDCHAVAVFPKADEGKQVVEACTEPGGHKGKAMLNLAKCSDWQNLTLPAVKRGIDEQKRQAAAAKTAKAAKDKEPAVDLEATRAAYDRHVARSQERRAFEQDLLGRGADVYQLQHSTLIDAASCMDHWVEGCEPQDVAAFLGLPGSKQWHVARDAVRAHISGADPNALRQVSLARAILAFEGHFVDPESGEWDQLNKWSQEAMAKDGLWGGSDERLSKFERSVFCAWLSACGFEPTDIELEAPTRD